MHAFVERLSTRIQHPSQHRVADSLADANEIFRIWTRFGGNPASASGVFGPSSEEIEFPTIAADDVEVLKRAVVAFIRANPRHERLDSAVHALYYLGSPDTKDLLVEVLRGCIGRDPGALYQTMIALEALGDDLFGGATSSGIDEVERNEGRAREYLLSAQLGRPAS